MKKLFLITVAGLTLLLLLVLVGCEGVAGPRGDLGDPGDTGDPWVPSIENRYFALAVTNNSFVNHNGAPVLYLAFDSLHTNAGDTVVCQRLPEGQVPAIDGVDEGEAGWGDKFTTVGLVKASGSENYIDSATIRAAYDAEYIYFQVKWTETASFELFLESSESNNPQHWTKLTGTGAGSWVFTEAFEDRLYFLFEVSEVDRFDHEGCFITCHDGIGETNYHATNLSRQRLDAWVWGAATTQHAGYAADYYIDNTPLAATFWDLGTPSFRLNEHTQGVGGAAHLEPIYQHVQDPNHNAPFPLWDWEITTFDLGDDWQIDATIPGYITSIPSGSAADVMARGRFADGTWTVELKRARKTGNGDDAQF